MNYSTNKLFRRQKGLKNTEENYSGLSWLLGREIASPEDLAPPAQKIRNKKKAGKPAEQKSGSLREAKIIWNEEYIRLDYM